MKTTNEILHEEKRRAHLFLALYNELDDHLRRLTLASRELGYQRLLTQAAEKNAAVKHFLDDLRQFGYLRNAIVHHTKFPEELIAVPAADVTAHFSAIVSQVTSPPRVIPLFGKSVREFAPEDELGKTLDFMKENDFSQVVVRASGRLTLLTSDGLAEWLRNETAHGRPGNPGRATVQDALGYERPDAVEFVHPDTSVYDVRELFTGSLKRGRPRLFAVVITQSGDLAGKPIGFVTPWDLLQETD